MAHRMLLRLGLLGVGGASITYNIDELETAAIGALRFGRAAVAVTKIITEYRSALYSGSITPESDNYKEMKSQTHLHSARELLDLCCTNGGAFVKVGQHLGSLEYLLPVEYVNTMKVLHSNAPRSSLEDVYQVIEEELKCKPKELFLEFEPEPLGAASLAQVHRAKLHDGREVAVKVQHRSVKAHSKVDMKGMELLVKMVSHIFPDFRFEWLVEEMKKNLPKELDFMHEARNAEKVAAQFAHFSWLKIPFIDWSHTTDRVLVMEFCEGGQVNDRNYMVAKGINTSEVSERIGRLYSEMIFVNGYVHCDPHPGNVLVKKVNNEAQIILLDHGLYTNLTSDFRITYSKFWLSILNADLKAIQRYGDQLGVGELFGLFACMVTGRSWDSISKGIDKKERSSAEQDAIKADAAKYLPEISAVLNRVPRQMLLILKTNDLLRGIEFSLNTQESMKSFITMSRCCIRSLFAHQRILCNSTLCSVRVSVAETWAQFKISLYTLYLLYLRSKLGKYIHKTWMTNNGAVTASCL
ncbi:aarF domain-containing protein kinase 1-like isoform X1 [Homarus americanus]|uniref:aarF domain-containing protein kinase 1-like isoform X1 n=2 Tax=Homarus americanus TaxID=6706 RepID=UPI001C480439|nr:aarF domain-containing protein kinase 1-like isoform X1 [Homarus americanus]